MRDRLLGKRWLERARISQRPRPRDPGHHRSAPGPRTRSNGITTAGWLRSTRGRFGCDFHWRQYYCHRSIRFGSPWVPE